MTNTQLPAGLVDNPRLEQWLRILPDGRIAVQTGKVELGQGILTALAQIAAEELCIPIEIVAVVSGRTDRSPNEGYTAGSLSIQTSGAAIRVASADAMRRLTEAARRVLGADDVVPTFDGRLGDGSRTVTYRELAGEIDWSDAVVSSPVAEPASYRLIGTPVKRLDLERAITGGGFIHDLALPGMAHGRVLRPPSRSASLRQLDIDPIAAAPGVIEVVLDGRFIAVIAEREEQALAALEIAREAADWQVDDSPDEGQDAIEALLGSRSEILRSELTGDVGRIPSTAALRARYSRPFIAHASIGPSCSVARFAPGEQPLLTVWSHSQGMFALRGEIARALALEEDAVTVIHVPGAGSYGHNGADDAAFDAALLARALPGRPVRVVWSREDELSWSPAGSAMVSQVEASLDGDCRVASWQFDVWSGTHAGRPGIGKHGVNLLAAWDLEQPLPACEPWEVPLPVGGGGDRNAAPIYDFPAQKITYHLAHELPVRTSSLRSLGAFANVFATESFMDELAELAEVDPIEFRLRHLSDERAANTIRAAAELAGWPGRPDDLGADGGLGLGFARYKNSGAYCAVVAEVEVVEHIRLRRMYCAVDAGLVINPDGLVNQIEGGIVQAASWTLKECVPFDRDRIKLSTWDEYPILQFSEIPEIDVRIVDPPNEPSLGVGECAHGPTAAAIANALYSALGTRVRDLPLTRDAIVRTIEQDVSPT